jgi:hypothetical protein
MGKRYLKGLTYQDIATVADKRRLIEVARRAKDWTRECRGWKRTWAVRGREWCWVVGRRGVAFVGGETGRGRRGSRRRAGHGRRPTGTSSIEAHICLGEGQPVQGHMVQTGRSTGSIGHSLGNAESRYRQPGPAPGGFFFFSLFFHQPSGPGDWSWIVLGGRYILLVSHETIPLTFLLPIS